MDFNSYKGLPQIISAKKRGVYMMSKKAKGFTLVELIVVIAIVGVLAAVIGIAMASYLRDARVSQANSDARNIHTFVQGQVYSPYALDMSALLSSYGDTDTCAVVYDGTGYDNANDAVKELFDGMKIDHDYHNSFAIFVGNAGSSSPKLLAVYVYIDETATGDISQEPDGQYPVEIYDVLNP